MVILKQPSPLFNHFFWRMSFSDALYGNDGMRWCSDKKLTPSTRLFSNAAWKLLIGATNMGAKRQACERSG
jgi:hypothetical protein